MVTAHRLFTFGDGNDPDHWTIVNDGVMGGRSRSRLILTPGRPAVFEGRLSLENNGGFASFRSRPARLPTAGATRIAARLCGDGRRYQLRLRADDRFDGVAYRAIFGTRPGEWMSVVIPCREFVPSFRGRMLPDHPPLAAEEIRQVGFMIADGREGEFRLEIDRIDALE